MPPETDPLDRTVLLVDSQQEPREIRARRLRRYGIAVHTVSSIKEARLYLEMHYSDLVLLATRENPEAAIVFRREIRRHNPKQRVAFLVGPPHYISFTYGQNLIPMPARSSDWADRLKSHLASA